MEGVETIEGVETMEGVEGMCEEGVEDICNCICNNLHLRKSKLCNNLSKDFNLNLCKILDH